MLFGYENNATDHTQQLSKMKNQILQTCLQGSYYDSLGEFKNAPQGMFGTQRVNIWYILIWLGRLTGHPRCNIKGIIC